LKINLSAYVFKGCTVRNGIMKKFWIFLTQFFGYLWYFTVFVIIIPYILVYLSSGLDYLISSAWLSFDYIELLSRVPMEFINLIAIVVAAFGFLVVIESAVVVYQDAHAFPFTFAHHEEMTPSELITGGWYSRVRHPMILGYILMLIGLAFFVRSPVMLFWWIPLTGGLLLEYGLMVEEKHMLRWFGDEYEEYQRRVPAMIPRFTRKKKGKKEKK